MYNKYSLHVGHSAAVSSEAFTSTVDGLIDHASLFGGKDAPSILLAQLNDMCQEHDEITCDLMATCKEITQLS